MTLTDAEADDAVSSKYQPLTEWLMAQTVDSLTATFEDIFGLPLPASTRTHLPYWYSTANVLGAAVHSAGFKASGVNLNKEEITFVRE